MSDKTFIKQLVVSLALASSLSVGANADFNADNVQAPLDLSLASSSNASINFEFTDQKLGGFERKRMSKDLRIRGWRITDHLYVGQAKVAKKWGLGLVYEVDNTVYGLNHRGLQITKRF